MRSKGVFALIAVAVGAASAVGWLLLRAPVEPPSRDSLIAIASDRGRPPDARGEAVRHLFADHVMPGATAAEVREAFAGCDWIAETSIFEFVVQTGDGHPLWVKEAGTLFRLDFFASEPDGDNKWIMYARFSAPGCSIQDVRRFFSPKAESDAAIRLTEFALRGGRTGKWEVFDASGRHPPTKD